jgi:hypothetical protein
MGEPPTLYEWVKGRPAIARLIDAFYDRAERDDLLSPLFPGGVSAAHREHVTSLRPRSGAAADACGRVRVPGRLADPRGPLVGQSDQRVRGTQHGTDRRVLA